MQNDALLPSGAVVPHQPARLPLVLRGYSAGHPATGQPCTWNLGLSHSFMFSNPELDKAVGKGLAKTRMDMKFAKFTSCLRSRAACPDCHRFAHSEQERRTKYSVLWAHYGWAVHVLWFPEPLTLAAGEPKCEFCSGLYFPRLIHKIDLSADGSLSPLYRYHLSDSGEPILPIPAWGCI